MKKNYLTILAAALAALLSGGCGNTDLQPENQSQTAPGFSATIIEADTRAFDSSWEKGDEIGVSGCGRTNVAYLTGEADGSFSVKTAGQQIYYRDDRQEDFTAYYPWNNLSSGVSVISADTKDQTKQKNFDFLWGKASGNKKSPNVAFSFGHKMSKLTLIFKSGSGMDVSKIVSYELTGLVTEGDFNTVSGVCSAKSGAAAQPISFSPAEGSIKDGDPAPSLILFPQSVAGKTIMLRITDSENQYFTCQLNFSNNNIVAGNNYRFTVTVNKTGLAVSGASITNWSVINTDSNASSSDYPEE